ncbi:MAG: hypothetical protein WD069_01515 [Planctomycetales bacterium]
MPLRRTGTFALVLLAACGCALRGNVDALEGRLRVQEDALADLESQLATAHSETRSARREADALRAQLADRGAPILLPEQAQALYRVEKIAIEEMLTGGLDSDGLPGDDELNVLLVPRDEHGEPVKLPGDVRFELSDPSRDGAGRQLGTWEFPAERTRGQWLSGLIGTGYQFRLPWQEVPASPKLLLHARLVTADGRQFDATHTVSIRPPATEPAREVVHAVEEDPPPAAAPARLPPDDGSSLERLPPPVRTGEAAPLTAPAPRRPPAERTDTSDARRDWEFPVLR